MIGQDDILQYIIARHTHIAYSQSKLNTCIMDNIQRTILGPIQEHHTNYVKQWNVHLRDLPYREWNPEPLRSADFVYQA